jgi:hypothetical protein
MYIIDRISTHGHSGIEHITTCGKYTNLDAKDIHREPTEAADDRLLDVEAKAFKHPNGGQQDTRPSRAEHVDVQCLPFHHPHLYLNINTKRAELHSVSTSRSTTGIKLHDREKMD